MKSAPYLFSAKENGVKCRST